MNVGTWATGESMPAPHDYAAQEQQQYDVQFKPAAPPISTTMDFVEFGRPYIEQAAGGNGSWTEGVDFARLLARSPYLPEVASLYRAAGLDLRRDLATLTRDADVKADPGALRSLDRSSVPTGRLQAPELDMHTISDQLVPVQQENYYRQTVERAERGSLLRQAFVQRQLHCNFTPAELVAGVLAVQHRVQTGRWGSVATPARLESKALALGRGGAAFMPYEPGVLSGANGEFSWPRWW